MCLGYILLVVVTFAIQGFAVADNAFGHEYAIPRDNHSLRSSSKANAGVDTTNAETEERMKMPDFAKIFSFSKQESSVIKNSALTKTLSSNSSVPSTALVVRVVQATGIVVPRPAVSPPKPAWCAGVPGCRRRTPSKDRL
ncbi:hypothetical protein PF008_g25859 [Phytophthora fragariae]|uniref:RxLR effector protein n=1 Tax=Phytophthora fragariae TaxID=53985 RepID=A0A6G0QIR0_9STRA|nr:hypothetical protein PF008_g25859 [Phytophthora fragariae]